MLKKESYKPRIVDNIIKQKLKTFGAIYIKGPKWCGKTTTAEFHSKSTFLVDSDKAILTGSTLNYVKEALTGETPRLIDEWQEFPKIWDEIRREVDKRQGKGQFIITGSIVDNLKQTRHSGFGRYALITMSTMTLYEMGYSSGQISINDLVNKKAPSYVKSNLASLTNYEIASLIVKGGWPELINSKENYSGEFASECCKLLLEQELPKIYPYKRKATKEKIRKLLLSLSRNECTTVEIKTLIKDVENNPTREVSGKTIDSYLNILDALFLTDNIQPFNPHIRSRSIFVQKEKRRFIDPSLATGFLKIDEKKILKDLNYFGFLFESMVIRDLQVYASSNNAQIKYYRDYNGYEIDAIIEWNDGRWAPVEIKLSDFAIPQAKENLRKISRYLQAKGAIKPEFMLIICSSGDISFRFDGDDDLYFVPITMLKN